MTDIALHMTDAADLLFDLALTGGQLATDDGLRTAIAISLFTDARAAEDDVLPEGGADRRGWWGDVVPPVEGDTIGSRLWLLRRSKITAATVQRAREYAAEAVAWLLADRVASTVEVETEAQRPDRLAIGVIVTRPSGPERQRFDYVWSATA
ncbi:phage GP46 family protein [Sphingomonas paucimobilis]|uniref:Phage GP46 family protein n=1 Tax=Sphingomonas paucimobilis TaxID=13689 RepID=A0A7T3E5H4_SPHPI|nr:phage GP46 family protein [Sphingomonas paucimobilis]QPT08575.1 phage GP46 family protein [Sphingomonas paucimobilis]